MAMFSPHDEVSSEVTDLSDREYIENSTSDQKTSKPAKKKNITFAKKIVKENKRKAPLKNDFEYRFRMQKSETSAYRVREFIKRWDEEKKSYEKDIKTDDDRLVTQMVELLGIKALGNHDLKYLYDKFRMLRQLQLRIRDMDVIKLFRILNARGDSELSEQVLKHIQHDAQIGMSFVSDDDFMITGISDKDKETILENLDLDPENDEECTRWVSYILFFVNPTVEWLRLRRRFERMFFKMLDTSIIQSMMNRDTKAVNLFASWKIPDIFDDCSEARLSAIVRCDRYFSSYKQTGGEGHRGKLLLLMIRLRNRSMIERCIKEGISVTSTCNTGQTKELYWDHAKGGLDAAGSDDEMEEEDGEAEEVKIVKGKKKKNKMKITLRSSLEFETPLSIAITYANVDAFKVLLSKANPLRCDDIAIRATLNGLEKRDLSSSDEMFIFSQVIEKSGEMLWSSKVNKTKGRIPPHYCVISLLYQAYTEEREDIIDYLFNCISNSKSKLKPTDKVTKLLISQNIQNSLRNPKLLAKRIPDPDKPAKAESIYNPKRFFSKSRSLRNKKKNKKNSDIAAILKKKKSVISEDTCYVAIKLIDRFFLALNNDNNSTNNRYLYSIYCLLERFSLYLDNERFHYFLFLILKVMKSNKPGDEYEVMRIFNLKQMQIYLNIDNGLEVENMKYTQDNFYQKFLKHETVLKLLKFNVSNVTPNAFVRQKTVDNAVEPVRLEERDVILEEIFYESVKLNIKLLVRVFIGGNLVNNKDQAFIQTSFTHACFNEDASMLELLVKRYGDKHLLQALNICIEHCLVPRLEDILILGKKSLARDYLSFKIKDMTEEDPKLIRLKEDIVIYKVLVKSKPSTKTLRKIVKKAMDSSAQVNFKYLYLFIRIHDEYRASFAVVKEDSEDEGDGATQGDEDDEPLCNEEFLKYLLSQHVSQFENKPDKVQTNWLKFLLESYKVAARHDSKVEEYNDQVVGLLELKPEFDHMIDYESDSHDEEVELAHSQKTEEDYEY